METADVYYNLSVGVIWKSQWASITPSLGVDISTVSMIVHRGKKTRKSGPYTLHRLHRVCST